MNGAAASQRGGADLAQRGSSLEDRNKRKEQLSQRIGVPLVVVAAPKQAAALAVAAVALAERLGL